MAFLSIFAPFSSLFLFHVLSFSSSFVLVHHLNKNAHNSLHTRPILQPNNTRCALFMGSWVRDESYPPYQAAACPIIEPDFNCQMYGRPDSDYLKYRWQPANCNLPRFDGEGFLTKMRGKSVMFVGDSLGRNQWESLICMTWSAVPRAATQMFKEYPLSTFKFLDYGVTMSYYKAQYLVDIDEEGGRRVLKLEDISKNSQAWKGADVYVFDTGHWWTHTGSLQGWDMMESGGSLYQDMDRMVAMEVGLRTWARWVDSNIDPTHTRVFFQSFSPTHYNPSEWSAGSAAVKSCLGETSPTATSAYHGTYPDEMKVTDAVLREMKTPVYVLDITALSAMRKDAHPSIYSGDTSSGKPNTDHVADCTHWCLPGLPDTWNQLFYAALFF